MSAADLLEDSFPHATPEGYRLGCRSNHCPGRDQLQLSCSEAHVKAAGDWAFRRLVDQGATAAELAEFVATQREAATASDRADRVRARRAERPLKPVVMAERKSPRAGIPSRAWTPDEVQRLRDLHALGLHDGQIGSRIGRSPQSVWFKRQALGLPSHGRWPSQRTAS